MSRYKPVGWRNEGYRHSLARKGIKTKVNLIPLDKDDPYYYIRKHFPKKDFDGDGINNRNDCEPLNQCEQGKIHDFFDSILHNLHKARDITEKEKKIAQKQISEISTKEDLEVWMKENKKIVKKIKVFRQIGNKVVPVGAILSFVYTPSLIPALIYSGSMYAVGKIVMIGSIKKQEKIEEQFIEAQRKMVGLK